MGFVIFIEGVLGPVLIKEFRFGHIVINGKAYSQDVVIAKNKVCPFWWRKEKYKVDWRDLSCFFKKDVEILIIGTGTCGLLKPTPVLQEKLKEKGIKIITLPTKEAVRIFNHEYYAGKAVLGAFHLTY